MTTPDRDRELEEIFGDVLPSTTSDERDPAPDDNHDNHVNRDEWYERERPPHHDRD